MKTSRLIFGDEPRYYVQITSRRSGKPAVLKFVLRRLWSIAVLMFSVRQECKTFLGEICYRSLSRNCGRVEGNTSSGGAAAATVGDFLTFPAKTALRAPRHHVGNATLARFSAGRDNIHIITLARVVFFFTLLLQGHRLRIYILLCSRSTRGGKRRSPCSRVVTSVPHCSHAASYPGFFFSVDRLQTTLYAIIKRYSIP